MIEAALYTLLIETEKAIELMPAEKVIEYFSTMAKYDNRFIEKKIGSDASGRDIFSYSFGNGPHNCLFYAFPDPGEAIGGRGIIALANLLQIGACNFKSMPVTWHFIPCLNFIDQPDNGKSLQKVMKKPDQEVDWCLNNPRPETTALLQFADMVKPCFSMGMHDEAHCDELINSYIGLTRPLSTEAVNLVRTVFYKCQATLNSDYRDPQMGEGFFTMSSIGEEFKNSTFSHLNSYGQVMVADIGRSANLKTADLVFLQLAAGLIGMDDAITRKKTS